MMPPEHSLRLTVIAAVTALAGLIAVQMVLLMDAFELKQQAFRQNVNAALSAASVRLAAGETLVTAYTVGSGAEVREDSMVFGSVDTPQRVQVHVFSKSGDERTILDGQKSHGRHAAGLGDSVGQHGRMMVRFDDDSVKTVVRFEGAVTPGMATRTGDDRARQVFVSRVIENLWVTAQRPIEERISRGALDSVLDRSLEDAGITLTYSSGVLDGNDSLHLAQPPSSARELVASPYRAPLFLYEGPGNRLVVHFPGRQLYLLQQLWPVLLASVVFLGAIITGFVAGLRVIVRQRQLARSMVDFINNMTHEFKTPLSTVTLATEAIQRADVVGRKTKVLQYNRMIAEESLRMKSQVDRILNLAQLEEGETELQTTNVDMHALLEDAIRAFTVQVEARGGRILRELRAARPVVRGDPVHLLNIVHSLLDNANKYSPDAPVVTIATVNTPGSLLVRVSDQGKGIPAEHQERVFEKYYRVPTGNLHEVRGFGIGLSYVKRIVELHGGAIRLQSQPGTGTTVTLTLPLVPSPGETT
jgi:two-component system, OmpR family, phosphate regulon sensor histidine kinase PhoR